MNPVFVYSQEMSRPLRVCLNYLTVLMTLTIAVYFSDVN